LGYQLQIDSLPKANLARTYFFRKEVICPIQINEVNLLSPAI
jgi:hypothetical protein